jgi:hypothetical protein
MLWKVVKILRRLQQLIKLLCIAPMFSVNSIIFVPDLMNIDAVRSEASMSITYSDLPSYGASSVGVHCVFV